MLLSMTLCVALAHGAGAQKRGQELPERMSMTKEQRPERPAGSEALETPKRCWGRWAQHLTVHGTICVLGGRWPEDGKSVMPLIPAATCIPQSLFAALQGGQQPRSVGEEKAQEASAPGTSVPCCPPSQARPPGTRPSVLC